MTRRRWDELMEQCQADLDLAISQGDTAWAKTQRERRAFLVKIGRTIPQVEADIVTAEQVAKAFGFSQ